MLQEFISNVKATGLSKTNHFKVSLMPPQALIINNTLAKTLNTDGNKVQMFCESTNIPGRSINTNLHRGYGIQREMPNDITFEPFTMTVIIDNTHDVRRMFEDWMDLVCPPRVRNFSYYNQYVSNIEVELLKPSINNQDQAGMTFHLHEAYPKTVGETMLSYSNVDVVRLPVTIQYKYYTR